ncbi:hypothetical protein B0H17DRAFT_1134019 [Mycena rosella]|uniref:Peptidase A2 domain-containing protein n=1 Tax=Mycena rosella TaxID=1033263 RepID=A0AAD7GEP7_MYCRO|nr:hypothetical protein B0H17DRAFT_1134019 [Mycena rosella]
MKEARTRPSFSKPLEGDKSEEGRGKELPYRLAQPVHAGARTLPASESRTERRYLEDSRKAYELKAPVQREGLADELLERINNTEVTVKLGDLFGMSRDLREGEKLQLTRTRQQIKERVQDTCSEPIEVEASKTVHLAATDSQLMCDAIEVSNLPEVHEVFVTTRKEGGLPAGSMVAQDPYLQYLEGLNGGEEPKQIYVARDSVPLRVTFPYINSQGPVECVLDSGSQIVSISLAQAQMCGLVWDPNINIFMQSANGQLEKSMGLARNVPFRWGELKVYLQVHVIRGPAYKVLLGRPFDVLTKSRTDHDAGNQLLTLTDPNTGRSWTVPTYDRVKDDPKQINPPQDTPEVRQGASQQVFHKSSKI